MIILGLVLLLVGLFVAVKILFWVGLVLLLVGFVANFGPTEGARRRYW